jgi:hypothetical protein
LQIFDPWFHFEIFSAIFPWNVPVAKGSIENVKVYIARILYKTSSFDETLRMINSLYFTYIFEKILTRGVRSNEVSAIDAVSFDFSSVRNRQ